MRKIISSLLAIFILWPTLPISTTYASGEDKNLCKMVNLSSEYEYAYGLKYSEDSSEYMYIWRDDAELFLVLNWERQKGYQKIIDYGFIPNWEWYYYVWEDRGISFMNELVINGKTIHNWGKIYYDEWSENGPIAFSNDGNSYIYNGKIILDWIETISYKNKYDVRFLNDGRDLVFKQVNKDKSVSLSVNGKEYKPSHYWISFYRGSMPQYDARSGKYYYTANFIESSHNKDWVTYEFLKQYMSDGTISYKEKVKVKLIPSNEWGHVSWKIITELEEDLWKKNTLYLNDKAVEWYDYIKDFIVPKTWTWYAFFAKKATNHFIIQDWIQKEASPFIENLQYANDSKSLIYHTNNPWNSVFTYGAYTSPVYNKIEDVVIPPKGDWFSIINEHTNNRKSVITKNQEWKQYKNIKDVVYSWNGKDLFYTATSVLWDVLVKNTKEFQEYKIFDNN